MSVHLLIGRAGAGKTAWITRRIVAACHADPLGAPILLLVPRQATFQIERDLCCGTELHGFFRLRVVSFDSLCRDILLEVGGAIAPEVTQQGRQMILGRLLRKHQPEFHYFKSATSPAGLASEIGTTLDELERGGADLSAVVAHLHQKQSDTALAAKMADLELIHQAYHAFLGENRLDPDRRLQQAMDAFAHSALLSNATIYVDRFLRFSHGERKVLTALAKVCPSLHIALTIDPNSPVLTDAHRLPDDLSLFHRQELEYRKLHFAFTEAGIKIEPTIKLETIHRFQSPALTCVEQWRRPSTPATEPMDPLELIQAPDKRAEVEFTARRIRDLVAAGYRYRDITVQARQLAPYQDLIVAAFTEHAIPYFVDLRRSAAHHPLIQWVRAVLTIASIPWHPDAMTALIKSGLCDLNRPEADELENYVLLHGIRGPAWPDVRPWTGSPPSPSIQSANNLRRRIVDPLKIFLASFSGERSVRDRCAELFKLLETFKIRPTLASWITAAKSAGQIEQAAEHEQVWTELLALFDQLVELLGDEPMTLPDFQATLESAFEGFDLAIVPATVDQVLVGQVDRTHSPAVKAAIILGLGDRQFPLPPPPTTVLSDADRQTLCTLSDIEPGSRRAALDEQFLGYFAFTRASEKLIVTRPAADEAGRAQSPSSLWRKLEDILGPGHVTILPRQTQSDPADISTPRQLISGLMRFARDASPPDPTNNEIWLHLYHWLIQTPIDSPSQFSGPACGAFLPSAPNSIGIHIPQPPPTNDPITTLRRLAWPALSYVNTARLSPHLASQIFPSPLKARVRQLETFRACPFQHFANYGLHLAPRPAEGISGGDIARLARDVLDHILRDLLRRKLNWLQIPADELNAHLPDLILSTGLKLKGDLILTTGRNQFLLQRIEKMLAQFLAAQRAASRRGDFSPAHSHLRYGDGAQLPPLAIGKNLQLSGEIDRVDLSADGKSAVLYQYHLSARPLALAEVYHGISLKLITDLLAFQSPAPGAALAASLGRSIRDDDPKKAPDPTDEKFDLLIKPRGLISDRAATRLDARLQPSTTSEAFALYVNKEADFGMRGRTDIANSAEFAGLLAHVRATLETLAAAICAGDISISPYRLAKQSPCSRCSYMDLCRFESTQGYVHLKSMKREEVLDLVKLEND